MIDKKIVTSGKRKSAVARAIVEEGEKKITINKRSYQQLEFLKRLMIEEPIRIAKEHGDINFNISVNVRGGGQESQIEASRLAIARALVEAFKQQDSKKAESLRRAYVLYDRNMLIADVRRREPYKPGDSKARAKRQKSYR